MSFHKTHLIYASEMQHVIIPFRPFSWISLIRTQYSAPIKLQLVCCVLIVHKSSILIPVAKRERAMYMSLTV